MSIPLQSTCDMDNPEEHVLWALVGLAGPNSHAPMVLPVPITRKWSRHLYDAGYRHHPELQKVKYIPPAGGTNWVAGSAGKWVDINTPLTPEQTAPDVSHLTVEEKQILLQRLATELIPNFPDDSEGVE